jgi:hypothetical protein
MSVIQTDLRVNPIAAARNVSYDPSPSVAAIDVQHAIETVQANLVAAVAVASVTPPAIVPTAVNFAMSPYTVLATDYLLEVDSTGGAVVIQTAASASRANKPFTVKAINANPNGISVNRTAAETIDGLTSYPMVDAYDAKTFKPKLAGDGYEVES